MMATRYSKTGSKADSQTSNLKHASLNDGAQNKTAEHEKEKKPLTQNFVMPKVANVSLVGASTKYASPFVN